MPVIALKLTALLIGVVAVIGVGAFAPAMLQGPTVHGAASSTFTTATHCTTGAQSTSSATVATTTLPLKSTTTSTSTSGTTIGGSFTYSPSSPVKVTSVQASIFQDGGGGTTVSFAVSFQNGGTYTIYTAAGCGSGLTAEVPPGSPVLQKVNGGPVCLCAEMMAPVDPGQNHTSYTPGCWSGYHFALLQPGTVQVDFTLYWGSMMASPQATYTNVTAWFTFS